MRKYILLLLACCGLTAAAQVSATAGESDRNLLKAALKGWHVRVGAGISLGGTAPLPLPAEIRGIETFNPTLCIQVEGAAHKMIDRHWGVMVGVRFANKGMETDATVKNYHMEAVSADGQGKIEGAWTGRVRTDVDLNYLTFPLLATYTFKNDRWSVNLGPYFSYMMAGEFSGEAHDGYIRDGDPTGPRADVDLATYDFSNDLRRFHWGLQAGGEYKAFKHLSVSLNLQWGLNGIFSSDFTSLTFPLHPIYGTLGFNYLF